MNQNTIYDLAFVGHMCFDEILPFEGETVIAPGSAVLCGAMAAARIGKRVLVITKMAASDAAILEPLHAAGVETLLVPAAETSYMQVIHPSANVDERNMFHRRNAGFFELSEIPPFQARRVHLAGICDREFTLAFMRDVRSRGYALSADMQNFVRQVQPDSREVLFQDVPAKRDIAALLDMVKLDIVEARLLTGTDNLEQAAIMVESWGCPEVVITQAEGVLARVRGQTYYEKFSNRSVIGRTGRGDTTFAGYLARRLDHEPAEALKFAAALVSLKMEKRGPFSGTLTDVLTRLREAHA